MDTNRAATLMTRAAWSAVIALRHCGFCLELVSWFLQALRECLMEELMGEHGDRQAAEASYRFRGAGGDNDISTSLEIARLNCKSGRKPIAY